MINASGVSFEPGDQLRIIVRSINATVWRIIGNVLYDDGIRSSVTIDLNYTNADRSQQSATTTPFIKSGILTSATVKQVSGTVGSGPGESYITAFVDRSGEQIATLIGGYFYRGNNLSFPASPVRDSQDGPGRIYTIATADPAAAAEIAVIAVPTNAKWK